MARKSPGASPGDDGGTPKSASPKRASKAAATKAAAPKATKAKAARGKAAAPEDAAPASGGGRALVIVESPKKAKSINKFLGSKYIVKASMGHVRDLPKRKLGLDVADGYAPSYEVVPAKKETVTDLKREAARAGVVYLATDPDREGEAIAWHLQQALELPDDRVRRVTFHEITERAVRDAFTHVGPINVDMVNAQQARRFLDRFVGYQLSPLLWSKVARNLSAGRVQSVAVRLIADREKEIRAFVSEEYWKITATVSPAGATAEADRFEAGLVEYEGAKFAANNEADAHKVRDVLASERFLVSRVDEADKQDRADPPFKTSTLQQQAAIRLRYSGKKTMKIAQELYEGIDVDGSGPVGLITYMRTDSLSVSQEAMEAVRGLIHDDFGDKYLPAKPIRYAAGKNAQEAHEAIRPTDLKLAPDKIKGKLSHDQFRLYQLIYWRFVASQMAPAVFTVTDVAIAAGPGLFKTQGKVLKFDGHKRVWPPGGKLEDALLPPLKAGQELDLHELAPTQHFTQPPPRYSEATLIKALEKENIGRPSTYAPIIQTIQDRMYVEQKERRFFATDLGMVVTDLLVKHFPKILDLKFTAHMEDELDDIATAKEDMVKVLDEFYYPFQDALKTAQTQMERVSIPTDEVCHVCGAPMVLKFGRTGQFLGCSKYPECKATRPLGGQPRAEAVESGHACPKCHKPLLIRENKRGEKFLSCSGYPECKESFNIDENGNPVPSRQETEYKCEKCGKPMALRQGRRGPFLGCTGYPKCRNVQDVDAEGKPVQVVDLGINCEKCGKPMKVRQGRRGPFLGCTGYPKCRGTAPIPEDKMEQVAAMAPAPAAAAGPDLKTIEVDETCDDCGGAMTVRRGRRGYFLGCKGYPKCKGTKEPSEATLEKITSVMGA
ncbi:DNA topoisomerase 1 [Aquisphaera giovannonii]|uniref:DNA topoisomerase 1 n=1 Tax=Aquisphaera giovannonii TaxID=406548 RepID=A0A5B9W669_9BACT|nr:type I DNA topoisomerase [Aquisphaera giovannonii]QEH36152.1 DNA topoisomerase 1 [Aquisphaera giovannonii]